jgi:nitroreductase
MDLFEAIAKRGSYRGPFSTAAVPRADLKKIVAAGIRAPSGKNEQVISFVIVDDPQLRGEIARIVDKTFCYEAQAIIALVADPRPVFDEISFAAEDCAAAAENMLLAVTALGYATVWLDGVLRREGRAEKIGALLGVPPGHVVRMLLPIGAPAQSVTQKEKLPFDQRAWFNRYRAVS